MSLEVKKATSGNISPRMLKTSSDICSPLLASCFNVSLLTASFPNSLKCASITLILKKGDATRVNNYRPISILPTVSKIFEKIMAAHLSTFFETRFSKFNTRYYNLILNLKPGKTELVIYGTARNLKTQPTYNVEINGSKINYATRYEYLRLQTVFQKLTLN